MPFFRYSGTDKSGKTVDGTVEAPTADDAMLQLVRGGVNVSQLMKALGPAPAGQTPAAPATPTNAQPQRPASQILQQPPQPSIQPSRPIEARTPATAAQASTTTPPSSTPDGPVIRTKPASDKDRMFLFSQLAKQLKAGMGPAAALDDLKIRVPHHISASLSDASENATNGKPISDVFARYPDLYPQNVVGTIRAGEQGGFLEEACEILSDQALNAHQFNRLFWWAKPMILNALVSLPLVVLILGGVVKAWDVVEAQGEEATRDTTIAALKTGLLREFLWPIGPITIIAYALLYWLYRSMSSLKAKRMRHEVALKWPVFGKRTLHECLAVFSWTMSRLSKSGISPNRSWELAADSVPNLAVKERLLNIGRRLTGAEKLSDAVFKEKLFPGEYAPVLATAEHTGDMPGAFDQLAKISQIEFDAAQTDARLKANRWANAGCMAVAGLIFIILAYMLYYQLMPAILRGLD